MSDTGSTLGDLHRPVSDPPRGEPRISVQLTTEPLGLDAALAAVRHPEAGGVGLFAGVVRDHHGGAPVTGLTYEAWEQRAAEAMRDVGEEVAWAFPGVRALHIAHRLGPLKVGEVSVVVAASAPHRAEAFAASQHLIDRVKAAVPIWKQEHLADGTSWWPGS